MASAVIRAASRGDREALEFFVAGTHADVYRLTEALVGGGFARTATEVTFERAWVRLRSAQRADHLRAWLFTIALEVCRPYLEEPLTSEDQDGDELTGLLLGLPPGERTVFVLTQIAGLDYRHTAEVCGNTVPEVRALVADARDALLTAAAAASVAPAPGT